MQLKSSGCKWETHPLFDPIELSEHNLNVGVDHEVSASEENDIVPNGAVGHISEAEIRIMRVNTANEPGDSFNFAMHL